MRELRSKFGLDVWRAIRGCRCLCRGWHSGTKLLKHVSVLKLLGPQLSLRRRWTRSPVFNVQPRHRLRGLRPSVVIGRLIAPLGDNLIVHHQWELSGRGKTWTRARWRRCPCWGGHSGHLIEHHQWEHSYIWRRCLCPGGHSGHLIEHHQWEYSSIFVWRSRRRSVWLCMLWVWRRRSLCQGWHSGHLQVHHQWEHLD